MYEIRPYSDKKIKAICLTCGKKFVKNAFNQKFCSPECKRMANNQKRNSKRVRWDRN